MTETDIEREGRRETDCVAPTVVAASTSMRFRSAKVNASGKNISFAGLVEEKCCKMN